MDGALAHLRVVDYSDSLAGQYCARLFADFGASVVLVEPPGGSSLRLREPMGQAGESLQFFHLNHGKQSLMLDRAAPADAQRFAMLLRGADIAVLPADADADAVSAANPNCIVVQPSAFGTDGPRADWQGPEIVLQALSGMMHNNGAAGREPLFGVANRAAMASGVGAYVGTLAALFAREQNGAGQVVRIDAAETAATMCFPYVMQHIYNGSVRQRTEQAVQAGQVLCRDGWVCIWIYNFRWQALLAALDLPELEHDARFADPAERRTNWDALFAIFQAKVADMSAEDLVEILQQAQVIAAKAYRPSELMHNRHLDARDYWEEIEGKRILGPAFRLTRTPRRVQGAAPALGSAQQLAWPAQTATGAASAGRPPLEGLRVIELTTAWAGPMSGRVLAYLGAESIHVEAPNRVNSWRLNKDRPNPVNFPDREPGARWYDRSFLFNSQNVNKLSCILNLKTEEGRNTLRRLVEVADVLICNFRPGTLKKLGLDYDSLTKIKPDIIVAELPAFGVHGPMSSYAALGPTMEMAAGMSAMIGYPGGQPEVTGPSYLDPIGGFNAAAAILTALVHRQRTGEGQYVEVPQVEAAMQLIGAEILKAGETGNDPAPNGNRVSFASPHDAFPTSGHDQWIAIAALDEGQWQALCAQMGQPKLASDPRFADLGRRRDNEDELTKIIGDWTRGQDKHELAGRLQAAGVAAAPVQTPKDVAEDPYLAHRGFFTELEHPDAGRHKHPSLPMHLSATPGAQVRSAPPFGWHNRHVLENVLKLSPEEIAAIEASDAMATEPLEGH
ncbi:CoA transferase [Devosia sp. FJ2-5-3]|uniref:CaiB/BaiF CoA transferase family protein n=1 Tax=Devosia sp. FJ2-5-3 TaxID=2976680 RepID=UPI0023D8A499|nr:CoA transferase [Devosia sp. FJ2-5-3]WEJ59764.1 CoA transferase [Devosia sp. FJ2-5-3]